jgi:serine protease Do
MARHDTWGLCLSLLLSVPVAPAGGDILRYQDADGLWQFTDRPREGAVPIPRPESAPAQVRDLAAQLAKWRGGGPEPDPDPALAVVSVLTSLAEGAGFFCSPDGYVLTTRHVVRPVGSDVWQHGQEAIDRAKGDLEELEGQLQEWRSRLRRIDAQLASIDEDDAAPAVQARGGDVEMLRGRRSQVARRVAELERLARDSRRRTRSDRVTFDIKGASATLAASVEVRLADQTRLRARVVAVSDAYDLALLKLDGYRTPSLSAGPEVELAPGQSVFALGYPDDAAVGAAAGLVLRATPEEVVTSVQLVPGYSGGPLLDASAQVVGVSALKRVGAEDGVYAEGQGIAIPIAVAQREFPQLRLGAARAAARR